MTNEEKAQAWVRMALRREYPRWYDGTNLGLRDGIVDACAAALLAAVRAKGEADGDLLPDDLYHGAQDILYAHAADVPEPPR